MLRRFHPATSSWLRCVQLPGDVIGSICIVTDCGAIMKLVNKDVVVFSPSVLFVDGKFCPQEYVYISYFVSNKVHYLPLCHNLKEIIYICLERICQI